MALIYLSPSNQHFNPYNGGGNEAQYMNLIADEMEPLLRASGISYRRSTTDMTAADSIAASNSGAYALHLALHSNAAPEGKEGTIRGVEVYYDPRSRRGQLAAELIAQQLRAIYPDPMLVSARSTRTLGEVNRVTAPATLIEFAYHDNPEDARWLRSNTALLAQATVKAVAEYFGLPFLLPQPVEMGFADLQFGVLNIRSGPSLLFPVVAQAADGTELTIRNRYRSWFVVEYGGILGYALQNYVTVTPQ